jgi:hypothetical protein
MKILIVFIKRVEVSDKPVRPWDLFNKKMDRVDSDTYDKRIETCKSCPELIKLTFQCKKCGCFMKEKTKLANASCPLNKWDKVNVKEVPK